MNIPKRAGASDECIGTIIVVDDEDANRMLLVDLLESKGFNVKEAADGARGLELIRRGGIDAALLDVMMPNMSGFDMCAELKADPETEPIPVLLVTALDDRESRIEGISCGAMDFISKPIDIRDVSIRVRNAVHTKQAYDAVKENYRRLSELQKVRESLTKMIVHDMRSPLTGLAGNLDLLRLKSEGILAGESRELLDASMMQTERLMEMVNSMLDISRMQNGQMPLDLSANDLVDIAFSSIDNLGAVKLSADLSVACTCESVAVCDKNLIERVIGNLLANAIKFNDSKSSQVIVEITSDDAAFKVSVIDNGPGIPEEAQARIFEMFGQVKQQNVSSSGLGLTFCKLAIEAHEGKISVESVLQKGATFSFTLPRRDQGSS